jgi:hypothetical protein
LEIDCGCDPHGHHEERQIGHGVHSLDRLQDSVNNVRQSY